MMDAGIKLACLEGIFAAPGGWGVLPGVAESLLASGVLRRTNGLSFTTPDRV